MGFLLPINTIEGGASSDGFALDGSTLLEVAGEVMKTARVTFAGSTLLDLFYGQGSLSLAGATALAIAGRLNDEANIFGALGLEGSTLLEIDPLGETSAGFALAGATSLEINGQLDRAQDFGFTFFVDITGAAVTTALNKPSNIRRFTARLLSNGSPVPIIRASISAPPDTLGIELSVILARPDVSQISSTASIDLQLGIWAGGAWAWSTMFSQGRMSGRGAHYANQEGLPADSVEITFADIVGDRWNRAPRQPLHLYDPQKIDAPEPDAITRASVQNNLGGEVVDVYQAISGLSLFDVLDAAYVTGCGFDSYVTNIENFPVEEATFSLSGGYDAGVRPLLSPYEPIVFPVGNVLWIVTLDEPLPAGFSSREFASSLSLGIDDTLPTVEPVNALLVHLKDSGTGDYFTERLETKTVTAGTYGTPNFSQTDIERRVREYRNFDAPTVINREDEVYLKTRTLDSDLNEIGLETRTTYYDALNRPKGYLRKLSSLLPDPGDPSGAKTLQPSLEESQTITYAVHPLYPARDVQKKIETLVSGLILTDPDNLYLDKPYKIPLHDAHKSGYVEPDSAQTTSFGALRTITEDLIVQGGQVVRERRVVNHVAGVEEPPVTQTLPGDASFDRRRGTGRTRTVLLTVAGTDEVSRRVADFDGTGLSPATALALANKRLARLNAPPRDLAIEMSHPDPVMRRGLDLSVRGRDGILGVFIVRGFTLTVTMQDDGSVDATMNLTAKELKA
jgi:hypothetical protein